MEKPKFVIGADYGTNSARFVLVNAGNGEIVVEHVYNYQGGEDGIILDSSRPLFAKQDTKEYFNAFYDCMDSILKQADRREDFDRKNVVGIAVDTTGSTPIPVDSYLRPIGNAWLWKDKTSAEVSAAFNKLAREEWSVNRPDFTKYSGGLTSPEWMLSKVIQLAREDPEQYAVAASFVEHCDLMPAWICGETDPKSIYRSRCAAGHKAHFHEEWGGLPSQEFIDNLALDVGIGPGLLDRLIEKLYSADRVVTADKKVGNMIHELAVKYGLNDIAVAAGAFDAHMGAVGVGIKPGVMTKIMGTSTCDMMVSSVEDAKLVEGICGQVNGSIIPGMIGYEAGQSSAGDTLRWMRNIVLRTRNSVDDDCQFMATDAQKAEAFDYLSRNAARYGAADVNIIAAEYFNGIRTPSVDPEARGMLLGLMLEHKPGEVYRALVEGVAFGALAIMRQFKEYELNIDEVVACGGLTKSDLVMQIHADVTGVPHKVSSVSQTCALGAAMFAAVAAGVYENVEQAQAAMNPVETRFKDKVYEPDMKAHEVYQRKFGAYDLARKNALLPAKYLNEALRQINQAKVIL